MIGHKYTPTVGHTGSYAFGDHVRRNLGATVVELGIPPALAVGSVNLNQHKTYREVVELTGLSKSTLIRAVNAYRANIALQKSSSKG